MIWKRTLPCFLLAILVGSSAIVSLFAAVVLHTSGVLPPGQANNFLPLTAFLLLFWLLASLLTGVAAHADLAAYWEPGGRRCQREGRP